MSNTSRTLNKILAVEKGIKQRANTAVTELHKVAQQPTLFNGHTKTYEKKVEDAVQQPPQSQKVAYRADEVIASVQRTLTELFDVTASKEYGNQTARADLIVDGTAILTGVPATYFLFLDKQLTDLRTFVDKIVELDPAVDWTPDPNSGLFRSNEVRTHHTNKVTEHLVIVPATEHHPANVQPVSKDVVVGEWATTRHSGAIPATQKKKMLERIQKLLDAVKVGLEQANMTPVADVKTGNAVLNYIFG